VALVLLALGFIVGYGYHTLNSVPPTPPATITSRAPKPVAIAPVPPTVKGLRASPDGTKLAFTGVSNGQTQASRFVFDLKRTTWSAQKTPRGWQDYIVQWSTDNKRILFDREKIPRVVDDSIDGGLHQAQVVESGATANKLELSKPLIINERALTPKGTLPRGEKSIAGFWTPDGVLVVKTRREPKTLFMVRDGKSIALDRANSYQQHRAVRENGKTVFYVVRDVAGQAGQSALYRVEGNNARRLSEALSDVKWPYVAEGARWMVICRDAGDDLNWMWTLYRVSPQKAVREREELVTQDVSGVFWSPDRKSILGASGKSLWIIDIPTLRSRRLGPRSDWNADDATWLPRQNAVVVASKGALWEIDTKSGAARELWKFPAEYWN
jgi:hypothetical protein